MQGLILARSGDWVQVLTSVRGDKRDKNRILIHRGMMQDTGLRSVRDEAIGYRILNSSRSKNRKQGLTSVSGDDNKIRAGCRVVHSDRVPKKQDTGHQFS